MKKLKIILRIPAMNDLEEIWLYTYEAWSLEQADRYHRFFFNEIEFLSTRPEHGKKSESPPKRLALFSSESTPNFLQMLRLRN